MFTGIIKSSGQVTKTESVRGGLKLTVDIGSLAGEVKPGHSLSLNGACLTVCAQSGSRVSFDVVSETLKRTNLTELTTGEVVNLERAIRAGEPFGGHFVQGHIDGLGTISRKEQKGDECLMEISVSPEFTSLMIEKGSIAVDGISLTIVEAKKDKFSVVLIPYTFQHTTLGKKTRGDKVNIELDIIGKWVSKLLGGIKKSSLTWEQLHQAGF